MNFEYYNYDLIDFISFILKQHGHKVLQFDLCVCLILDKRSLKFNLYPCSNINEDKAELIITYMDTSEVKFSGTVCSFSELEKYILEQI